MHTENHGRRKFRFRTFGLRAMAWVDLFLFLALGFSHSQIIAIPTQPKSEFIVDVKWDKHRFHVATGDTWPLTWASDGNLYGAAGDNERSPMNVWKFEDRPEGPYSGYIPAYDYVVLVE